MKVRAFALLVVKCFLLGSALGAASARAELRGSELRRDDPEMRVYLAENMPPMPKKPLPPTQEEIQMLTEVFENADVAEAENVAFILGDWPGKLNADPLLRAIASQWPEVRAQAASSLAMLEPLLEGQERQRAVRQLMQLLADGDREVVLSAIRAIGKLKAADARDAIARYASSDDPELTVAALRALGEIGDPASFEQIRKSLASANTDVVRVAIAATGGIGDPALAQHLLEKLSADSSAVRVAAIQGIVSLKARTHQDQLVALLEDPLGYIRREALKGFVELGGAEHETIYLARTKDPDATVRRVAAQALGRFGLRSGIDPLYALFADPHLYVRDDAVLSLVAMADEKAIALAAQGLQSPKDTVRASSSQTLGRLKNDRNLEAHIALLNDPYVPARQWAAWALGEIGRKEACRALNEHAFSDKEDLETKVCAMLSLGKLGFAEALPAFGKLAVAKELGRGLSDPLLSQRLASVRSIGMLKNADSVGLLVGRVTDEDPFNSESQEVKYEAAVALGRIGSAAAVTALDTYMKAGGTQKLRYGCRWALTRIQGRVPDYQIPPPLIAPDYFVNRLPPAKETPGRK